MIEVRKVDGNGTLELVTDDAQAEAFYVEEALVGSDWEDTWAETNRSEEDDLFHMKFDKGDQAAILRLLNEHDELDVARCSG